MAASELRVQPQLEQAWAVRGTAATSGINKQQEMSGVAVPRRAMTEVFMASPEKHKRRDPSGQTAHLGRNGPSASRDAGCWIESGEARRAARGLLACWTEAGVGLRNLDGRCAQRCDLD